MFITFEGIGGCGKTTQIKNTEDTLLKLNHEVVRTREPGGSPGAEEIRTLILEGEVDKWSPETEILLFNAARRDHLEKVVWPAQEKGKIVISDRFADSTRVYQGVARAEIRPLVDQLHELAIGYEPDLTLVIDVSAEESLRRMNIRAGDEQDRFDEMGLQFQRDLRAGYLASANEFPDRVRIVDGMGTPDEVFARVWDVVEPKLIAVSREAGA